MKPCCPVMFALLLGIAIPARAQSSSCASAADTYATAVLAGARTLASAGDPLPPQNHHQHTLVIGPVQWRMLVFTQTDGAK